MDDSGASWYYLAKGQRCGPVTAGQLKQLARTGDLAGDDLVWREGIKHWTPARNVKGLLPQSSSGPLPVPPSSPPPIPANAIQQQHDAIRRKVTGPATALLVYGVLYAIQGLITVVVGFGFAALLWVQAEKEAKEERESPNAFHRTMLRMSRNHDLPGRMAPRKEAVLYVAASAVVAIACFALGIVPIVGALRMKRLTSFRLAIVCSILAIGTGGIVGIPIGIWCLFVLTKPDVKASFR